MKNGLPEPKVYEGGKLLIVPEFAGLFEEHGLTSWAAFQDLQGRASVKALRSDRITEKFSLESTNGPVEFYIKWHGRLPWKERLKAWVRLRIPIWGARPEWEAIHHFFQAGIPTTPPVALGESKGCSFLVTLSLGPDFVKVSELLKSGRTACGRFSLTGIRFDLPKRIGEVARKMHSQGLHHQDFYTGHLMIHRQTNELRVIDLGRARQVPRLSRHWIIKDLAQLAYSARNLKLTDQARFLRAYLGRPPAPKDRTLIRQINQKRASITRHAGERRA